MTTSKTVRVALTSIALLLAAAATGCVDGSATDPIDSGEIAMSVVPGGPDAVAAIRGGAHFSLSDPPPFVGDFKWIYRFSVNATARSDGTSDGSIKMMSKVPAGQNPAGVPLDWRFEVAVDCVEVEGNTAWMTGPVVRVSTDSPFGPPVGDVAIVMVEDRGNGNGDWINVGPAALYGATDCHDKPAVTEAATSGNIQIFQLP